MSRARRTGHLLLRALVPGLAVAAAVAACGDDGEHSASHDTTGDTTTTTVDAHDHGHGSRDDPVSVTEAADGVTEINLDGEVIEVTAHDLDADPTPEQQAAADQLHQAVIESLERFSDRSEAERAGYRFWQSFDDYHWVNPDHVTDGRVLDPERPEFLMYDGDQLLGVMFLPAEPNERGPQVGGPLTVWHYHRAGPSCWTAGGLLLAEDHPEPEADGTCPGDLTLAHRTPEMLHVWVVDHADGPFASEMPG